MKNLKNKLLIKKEKRVESDNLVNKAKMVIAEKSLSSIPREIVIVGKLEAILTMKG